MLKFLPEKFALLAGKELNLQVIKFIYFKLHLTSSTLETI